MKEYLYYGEVQQRINEYAAASLARVGFYDAVHMLWRDGRCHRGPELPTVSFADWDVTDVELFRDYMDRTPVDMDGFYQGFQANCPGPKASERISKLDVLPMMIAENQALGLHQHDAFEMLYVLSGQGRVMLNGVSKALSAGDLCIISPHYAHDVVTLGNSIILSVTFSEYTIEKTLYHVLKGESAVSDFFRTSLGAGVGYGLFHMPPTPQLLTIVRSIYHEGYSREPYARQICVSYLEIFFSCLMRSSTWDIEQSGVSQDRSLLHIVKYIQDNYRTVSLQEVAERFHYEPSYLGRILKSHLGKGYTELVGELRVQKAKSLLKSTALSMDKIAEQSGYRSGVYFSRCFREATGMTPSQYRKRERGIGKSA